MAKPNYAFEKRQRDLAKKKKKEEKLEERRQRKTTGPADEGGAPGADAGEAPPDVPAGDPSQPPSGGA